MKKMKPKMKNSPKKHFVLRIFLCVGCLTILAGVFTSAAWFSSTLPVAAPAEPSPSPVFAPATPAPTATPEPTPAPDTVLEDVPYISQEGILPTGCEVVSATMVVQYWGSDVSATEMADALPCWDVEYRDDVLYGPDPNEYFVGTPYSEGSYGCFAPVIAGIIPEVCPELEAIALENISLDTLYSDYVAQGIPVLIWATINLLEVREGSGWILPDGSTFHWPGNEHCMVLIGREEDEYICLDPYESNGQVELPADALTQRYQDLGSQAVVIVPSGQ